MEEEWTEEHGGRKLEGLADIKLWSQTRNLYCHADLS